MTTLCHQCHQAVPEGSVYCPECGAPQLRVRAAEEPEPGKEAAPAVRHAGDIVWPVAVRAAALFALPAGLLLTLRDVRGLPEILWVAAAAFFALRFYLRAEPRAPRVTPRLGGRFGLLVGLFTVVVNVTAEAVLLIIQRYLLHSGATIDTRMHSYAQMEIDLIKASGPDTVDKLGWLTRFWLSPEGTGTLLLLQLTGSAVFVLFFGWLTGRFAVRYSGRLRRSTS